MDDPNRRLFESVVRLLEPVLDELVFVGGCTAGMLISDPAAGTVRPTLDVDAIVDIATYAKYEALAERLRALGLREDTTPGAPLCRWRHGESVIDVMPIEEGVFGFSNRWYPHAVETAQRLDVAGHIIRVVTGVCFIATKLEAFRGRGNGDIVASHDLEDLIAVVDGRPEILDELSAAAPDVRDYIASEVGALLGNPDFVEALPGFLPPDAGSQARRSTLEVRLRLIASLGDRQAGR